MRARCQLQCGRRQDQQIRLQGSATHVPQDHATAITMIESGAVPPDDFITG